MLRSFIYHQPLKGSWSLGGAGNMYDILWFFWMGYYTLGLQTPKLRRYVVSWGVFRSLSSFSEGVWSFRDSYGSDYAYFVLLRFSLRK